MASKSILEEVELSSGSSAYVQITNGRGSLSFDGKETTYAIWLTLDEMKALQATIVKALQEHGTQS